MSSSSSAGSSVSEAIDSQTSIQCSICRAQFDDMAEMQRHMLSEHMQKGDLPNDEH
jgi:hypothetical protein